MQEKFCSDLFLLKKFIAKETWQLKRREVLKIILDLKIKYRDKKELIDEQRLVIEVCLI